MDMLIKGVKWLARFLARWIGAMIATVIVAIVVIAGLITGLVQIGLLAEEHGSWVWGTSFFLAFTFVVAVMSTVEKGKAKAAVQEKRKCIAAFTEVTGLSYPGYISINRLDDGVVSVTVRASGHNGERGATLNVTEEMLLKIGQDIVAQLSK